MQSDNSQNKNIDFVQQLDLIHALESGCFEALECPQCHEFSISVWFTHPKESEYRTWFVCERCAFNIRVQNSEKPRYFSTERID